GAILRRARRLPGRAGVVLRAQRQSVEGARVPRACRGARCVPERDRPGGGATGTGGEGGPRAGRRCGRGADLCRTRAVRGGAGVNNRKSRRRRLCLLRRLDRTRALDDGLVDEREATEQLVRAAADADGGQAHLLTVEGADGNRRRRGVEGEAVVRAPGQIVGADLTEQV